MVEARAATYQVEPDFAARQSIVWAIAWLLGAVGLLFVTNVLLLAPDIGGGLSFLSYGRLRGVAETTLWFGWLGTAAFAAVYAILPRITEVQLHNEVLGSAVTLTWSVLLTAGIVALVLGLNQGRPLGELPVGVDLGLAFMLVFVLYNAGVTVVRRRETTLYASGWYLLAAAVSVPVVFVVGNLPLAGVTDSIVSGFYQNGLQLLWLLPIGLGIAHYVIPVETGNPLYSAAIARAGFWSLVFAGGWTGQRLFLKGPGPDYLETIAVAMTFVLLVPLLSVAVNLFATGRGRWHLMGQAFGLRFAVAGLSLSMVWIVLVASSSIPWVSRYFGLTSFETALRHLAAFGVFSSFAFALIYHAYPLMVGRDWYSRGLVTFHFWGTLAAVVMGTMALLAAAAGQAGVLVTADALRLADAARASAGLARVFQIEGVLAAALLAAAQLAFAYNTFRTSRSGPLVRYTSAPVPVGSAR
jgi:cytochrome c oxidase cbb3-type subunit 1